MARTSTAAKSASTNGKAKATPAKPKLAAVVTPENFTYLPPVNPTVQGMSAEQLISHGELGETQAIESGLELLRRKRNRQLKKIAAAAAVEA